MEQIDSASKGASISPHPLGRDVRCWEGSHYLGRDAAKSRWQRGPGAPTIGRAIPEPCITIGPGPVWRMRRAGGARLRCRGNRWRARRRPGLVVTRRARMSFGPGGMARELIDLVVEAG